MAQEKSFCIIKDCKFVVNDETPKEVLEFHMEDINVDLSQQLDSYSKYLSEYFQEQKKIKTGTSGSKYLTLAVHYDPNTRKTVFDVELKKEEVASLCRALPHPFIYIRGVLNETGGHYGSHQLPLNGSFNLQDLMNVENWKNNCKFHTVRLPINSSSNYTKSTNGVLNILVGWGASVESIQRSTQYSMEKFYKDSSTKDLTIVAGDNGAEIKCHKLFFSALSPAFSAMLSSKTAMKEAKSGKIEMSDNSEEGLQNLIKYMYGMQLVINNISVDVALELFQTAHKYDLSHLEESLVSVFMKKDMSWFTPNTILELYFFVKKLEGFQKFQEYAIDLMTRIKTEKLGSCEVFKNLNQVDSTDISLKIIAALKKQRPKSTGSPQGVKRPRNDYEDDDE